MWILKSTPLFIIFVVVSILILQTKSFFLKLTTFPGIDDSTFDDIADSSNNSSLLLADDVQLQADESDESL